jgi:hypothetical protein
VALKPEGGDERRDEQPYGRPSAPGEVSPNPRRQAIELLVEREERMLGDPV